MLLAVMLGVAAVSAAEQVVVHQDVEVKGDKNPLADPVETVKTDTQLEVLSRDGGWVRVRTPNGKEGFVSADDLASNVNVADLSGNGEVRGMSTAAAGRGLEEDTVRYAAQRHLSKAGVDLMVKWGNQVTAKDLREFAKAGNVGPKKYRK